jgi:hypothetical protein
MHSRTLSRARVIPLAALAAASMTIGAAAPASAAPVSLDLNYTCTFPLLKPQPLKLRINTDVPSQVLIGERTGAIAVTATASVNAESVKGLRALESVTLEGSAVALTDVVNPNGQTLVARVPTTVAKATLPESGGFEAAATGATPSLVFQRAGDAVLRVRDLILTLSPRLADGTLTGLDTFETECSQDPGQQNVLATIKVVDPNPTPTPTPTPAPTEERAWTLGGVAYTKTVAQGALPITGDATTVRQTATGDLSGDVSLNPTRGTLRAYKLLPVQATFRFASAAPATGTLVGDTLALTTKQSIRLTNVSVFGINLVSGTCQTGAPATIALRSTAGAFSPSAGGSAVSTFTIPSFTNCGPLGNLVTGLTAGSGNALSLKFTPKTAA